jgi:murein DD-endopeptidase MepM/ murein hydrolase activator NlpD
MAKQESRRRGIGRALTATVLTGLVAACASDPPAPAPVIMNGAGPGIIDQAPSVPSRLVMVPPAPRAQAQHITVRPGQSLGGIAHAYRVSEGAIIAANHLNPPYKLETGQRLVIPGSGEPPGGQFAATAMSPNAPLATAGPSPDIIPLDGPRPAPTTARAPVVATQPIPRANALTPPPAAEQHPPGEPSAAEEARADAGSPGTPPPSRAEHFAWPVRGHVVAGYGVAVGGARNDGINIAAPQGTPVKAVDGGTVAYVGNELRGYGNLVLVKHEGGWISAYAHCEELLVKQGEKVNRGQEIAKVGATGGVSEPQLHFELRRGKRAVDPREFLTPAPSAGTLVPRG